MVLIFLRNGFLCFIISQCLPKYSLSTFNHRAEQIFPAVDDIKQYDPESNFDILQPNNTKDIVNVTCIVDSQGTGYIGTKNTTSDGYPCLDWSMNVLLYTRFKLKGKNITENFCRNPDGELTGPWCFILRRSSIKKRFEFRSCGIPICESKVSHPANDIDVGLKFSLKRDCPVGFKKVVIKETLANVTYCQVKPEYLSKLPDGPYSLHLINYRKNKFCPKGFNLEVSSMSLFCTRLNPTTDVIEFPKYLTPKPGELIFLAVKIGTNSTCPQMSAKTSIVIRKSTGTLFDSNEIITCHYFYKLSKNKITGSIDRRLAILVPQKVCPPKWSIKPLYKWRFMLNVVTPNKRQLLFACIPNEDVYNYPDGNYCLMSLSPKQLSNVSCPEDFIDVNMDKYETIYTKFCCTQSRKSVSSNLVVYDFFNISSMLIINNLDKCDDSNRKDLLVKQYTIESILHKEKHECINCDLFSVFSMQHHQLGTRWAYFKYQFRVCSYEIASSGFAYATLNARCPPNLNYAYIKYTKERYFHTYSAKATVTFCTILNYPKNISFPDGQYCLYKLGLDCPAGFQDVKSKLPLYFQKYSDSGGDITNYQLDTYCCKFGSKDISFENATLPYITSNSEFGLPYANNNFSCVHGLRTHTATEDSHMCHYYPTTGKQQITMVYTTTNCEYRFSRFHGSYRIIYSSATNIPYCKFFVNDRPPPGNYCATFSKTCPSEYFDYITYHPLIQQVICCRKPTQNNSIESKFTANGWVNGLKSFSLLAYKKTCPIFRKYNYEKETIKRRNFYKAGEIGEEHRINLTEIGHDVNRVLRGFSVTLYICDYRLDPYNKSITWPHGQYAFPKPLSGCPSNFKSGEFTHSMETANPSFAHSDIIHLDGDYMLGGSTIKWAFCVKKDNYVKDRLLLPLGRYCLMKVDHSCPQDFREGSVTFVEITALQKDFIRRDGALPNIKTEGPLITYYFCCQGGRGDIVHEPMNLPTETGSFFLLKYGDYCQSVFGMKYTEEFICIDSEDSSQYLNYTFQAPYKTEGATPVTGSFIKSCDFQINLCYYELGIIFLF